MASALKTSEGQLDNEGDDDMENKEEHPRRSESPGNDVEIAEKETVAAASAASLKAEDRHWKEDLDDDHNDAHNNTHDKAYDDAHNDEEIGSGWAIWDESEPNVGKTDVNEWMMVGETSQARSQKHDNDDDNNDEAAHHNNRPELPDNHGDDVKSKMNDDASTEARRDGRRPKKRTANVVDKTARKQRQGDPGWVRDDTYVDVKVLWESEEFCREEMRLEREARGENVVREDGEEEEEEEKEEEERPAPTPKTGDVVSKRIENWLQHKVPSAEMLTRSPNVVVVVDEGLEDLIDASDDEAAPLLGPGAIRGVDSNASLQSLVPLGAEGGQHFERETERREAERRRAHWAAAQREYEERRWHRAHKDEKAKMVSGIGKSERHILGLVFDGY